MKQYPNVRASALACAAAALSGWVLAGTPAPKAVALAPLPYYGDVARLVGQRVEHDHILRHPLNNEISQRAWTNLVTMYDYNHDVFLQSDLDGFARMQLKIDDALRAGDVSFGYEIQRVFVQRLDECVNFATNFLLKGEFDFATDETYLFKREKAPWPVTRAEREDLWRKRLKNDLLAQVLGKELDAEEEKSGKRKDKAKAADTNGVESVAEAKPEPTPLENLVRRYSHYLTMSRTEVDEETVFQRYMSAVMMAYDPHSDYMAPMRKEDFDMDMSLSLCGVGAVLSVSFDDGALEIKEIMKGGPIAREGSIKVGNRIVGVGQGNDPIEDVTWKPMRKTIRKIRGKKDTKVVLEITDKNGENRRRVALIRDEIKLEDQAATGRVETVVLNGVTNTFGYVRLPGFYGTMDKRPGDEGYRSCSWDVAQWIGSFKRAETDGMVLDLRGNGGGSLPEAILLTQLFVPKTPVVQIGDARGIGIVPTFDNQPTLAYGKPLVVLVDRHSASASEIVAGALQDTGRAVIVGDTQTHGKGTVQTVVPVRRRRFPTDESEKYGSMKTTTARFYRINGSSTQVKGVASDIRVPSVFDERSDIGEAKLPYALPWTAVQAAEYDDVWNMRALVPELRAASAARLKENRDYAHRLHLVAFFKAYADRTSVPLERDARLKLMRSDRATLDEADEADMLDEDDEDDDGVAGGDTGDTKKDLVLAEGFNVLADIVRLTNGGEVPRARPVPERRLPAWLRALKGANND
ncbi:MAG: carboxy terminal-processing peptidase [Kiritimatiellia bacterium]